MKYILLMVLVAVLFASACTTAETEMDSTLDMMEESDTETMNEVEIEENAFAAPQFQVETTDGDIISSDSGKPTLIYFMASWCPSCAKNWDALSVVAPEFEDSVNFFSISIDPSDTNEVLSELSDKKGFQFSSVAGDPSFANSLEVRSQTTVVGISSDGNIEIRESGIFSEAEWREMFESLQ